MKKWIIAEAVMVGLIIALCCLIKIQLTSVAQAEVIKADDFEFLVQTDQGLIPFSQVRIIKVEKEIVVPDEQKEVNHVLIYSHQEKIQQQIMQIEPELGETLIRLAHCESSINPQAVGDNGNSYGLYQIFLKWHPDITQEQAKDVDFSTRWTANKIRQGQGDLWTCWDKI